MLINQQFGSMKILKELPTEYINNKAIRMVEVICVECGTISKKRLDNIRRINTKGCSRKCPASIKLSKTHGKSNTKVYKSWDNMVTRITRPSHKSFQHYDDLIEGEKIDPRWLIFENFLADMGEPPINKKQKFSIDRINNTKGYCKENCRWTTQEEQMKNQERSINNMFSSADIETIKKFVNLVQRRATTEKFGKRSFTIKDIGDIFGIGNNTMTKILKGDYDT